MRLSQEQKSAIIECTKSFDANAKIILFGSRIDDSRSGGDIDLVVISDTISIEDSLKLKSDVCTRIGDQKIDIIITPTDKNKRTAFAQKSIEEGIEL